MLTNSGTDESGDTYLSICSLKFFVLPKVKQTELEKYPSLRVVTHKDEAQ